MAANAYRRDGGLSGLATGFTDLDHRMGGLQPSDLIIIAGRPAMGKTALATNIAYHVAKTYRPGGDSETALDGAVVGFFSLEMSAEQLATRIISEQAYIPSERIRRGRIDADEFDRIVEVSQELQHLPLYIDQTGGITVAQLAARARRLKRQRGLGFVVVDYLQLLSGSSKRAAEGRVQEVSEITTGLKALAKELHVPILALSQLSRQVEQREDKRPQLADLRESGSIEQDADVVLFVFREEYYLERSQPRENTEEHKHVAARNGDGDRQGRRDHRQAAARAHGHGDAAIHAGVHEVQQSRQRGAPAGAPRVSPARPREAASSERDEGPSETAILTIDLDALAANYRRLRDLAAPAECAAVVKADAYGLGMAEAAPALARAGCKTFFVATLGEAKALRALLPHAIIYVFAGLMPGTAELYRAHDLRPVLNSAEEIREWALFCATQGEKLPCAVHIDSGMNRLGLSAAEVDQVADARDLWQAMTLSLVMSHLACADEPEHPKSEAQRKIFDRLRARLPSGACEPRQFRRHPARARLCIRPRASGHRALWRQAPPPGRQSVSPRRASQGPHPPSAQRRRRRDGRLRRDKDVARDVRASPSSRWAMPTASSARCRPGMARTGLVVYLGAHAAPILGRVSMDLITIDVTGVPEELSSRGAWVELIGPNVSAQDMAHHAGTIDYEVLTNLGRRASRRYLGG